MGHVTCMVEMRSAYRIMVEKSEGKIPCGRHRCKCKGVPVV